MRQATSRHPRRPCCARGARGAFTQRATTRRAFPRAFTRAFTLAEALVSLAILTVLLVGMQSAIMLAGKAMPDANPLAAQVVDARRAQDVVASDLAYATNILNKSATEITFEVADRNKDKAPERIRIYWDPATRHLKRVYNGVESVVAKDVRDFNLVYGTRTTTETTTTTGEVEEATDRLLASYTGTAAAKDFALAPSALSTEKKGWAAEYFKFATPPPAGTSKVRFTRVDVKLKGDVLSLGDPTVGVYAASAAVTPTVAAALGPEMKLSRSGLSLTAYTTVSTTLPAGIYTTNFTGAFYVVLKGHDGTPSAYVQFQTTGANDVPHMEWTTDGGSTWQPAKSGWNAQDMWFRVYGRCVTSSNVVTETKTHYLSTVSMRLRTSDSPQSQIDAAVQLFNEPVMSGP
jgi:type II secretory pathway pseudopilin PulG